jgi:hypothetical protein
MVVSADKRRLRPSPEQPDRNPRLVTRLAALAINSDIFHPESTEATCVDGKPNSKIPWTDCCKTLERPRWSRERWYDECLAGFLWT